jgi:hypothetical protein
MKPRGDAKVTAFESNASNAGIQLLAFQATKVTKKTKNTVFGCSEHGHLPAAR